MDHFCGSNFWENLENPKFTTCFERTVLAWTPCAFLWIFLIFEIYYLKNSKFKDIPRNWLNVSKLVLNVLLLGVTFADLIYAIINLNTRGENVFAVDFTTPAIQAITYILAGILIEMNRRKGLRSSGLLFLFWFIALLCGVPRFQSLINSAIYDSSFKISFLFISYLVSYPVIVLEFLLHCPDDGDPRHSDLPINQNTCPERDASFLSRLVFAWFDPMAWKGFRRPLEAADMWELHPEEKSQYLVPLFNKFWLEGLKTGSAVQKEDKTVRNTSILPAIFKAFGPSFLFGAFLKFISDITGFFNPIILQLLIEFVWSDAEMWKGYAYAILLFANVSFTTFILSQYFLRMFTVGLRIRSALISAIFHKALRLSTTARRDTTVGEIVNLMSVDAQRFVDLIAYVNMIWSNPLQFGLCFYLLWIKLGPSVFSGLAVLLLLMPVDAVIAKHVRDQQIKQMKYKDQRVKLMNEILASIKVLKLNAWEKHFEEEISRIRNSEIIELKKSAYYDAANSFIWNFAPILVSLVSFATFVLSSDENILDADTAFVSLTLFNMMRYSLTMFPVMLTSLVQLSVAVKRITKFMNLEEIDSSCVTHDNNDDSPLVIENGAFTWGDEGSPVLQGVNLRVPKGSLVTVVGEVGSGKSSLLSAIIGEMRKVEGRVNTQGSLAYVSQQAWIQNATLKDNVLFGNPLDQSNYDRVIEACALKPDIRVLTAGDMTEIGEKGINLSGGQKQRVSLARAVYSDSDLYLLDDPLSAVDSHVAKHLYERVIGPHGLLQNKTRVLVTHGLSHLQESDLLVVMSGGHVVESGSYDDLISRHDGTLTQLVNKHGQQHVNEKTHEEEIQDCNIHDLPQETKENKLIQAEKAETGRVRWSVYSHYLAAVGLALGVSTFVFNILQQACGVLSNVWLSRWSSEQTNSSQPLPTDERDFYLGVYGGLGAVQALLVLVPSVTLVLAGVRAAVKLHSRMLGHTLRNPMEFFDTTPAGRIVNRFAKDVDVVDNSLPVNIRSWLSSFFQVAATLVVISFTSPFFLILIIPIGLIYYVIQQFYIPTSRQLKRLESVSRSPIYSHFGESLTGTSSIRAYGCEKRFENYSELKVDTNQMIYYLSIIANRWLAIRLEMLGNFVIFCSALLAVYARDSVSPGAVGLSISYALQITATLNFLVRTTSDVETNVVAVERIKEYGETTEEAHWNIPATKPSPEWPTEGKIQFVKFDMRYRDGMSLVLQDISCSIRGGEKIGIVGRTGAGKSSLTLGLFRLVEASGGYITIDDIDISTLGLHDLRSCLTIIPQDPVLFSGSLRSNVDPLRAHDDAQVCHVLELSHLGHVVREAGLDMSLGEGGEGLSAGQKQLVCLARALLRKTKILVLDEATGAIDLSTDQLIQQTIREEFKECTVITIAHRLNTVMDSDRVLVLEAGRLIESGSPDDLKQQPGSRFRAMCSDARLI